MAKELIASVLSLGLSIAFILVIVALVAKDANLEDIHLMNTKALKTMCKPTEYKEACYYGLTEVAKNTTATKKDYLFATFHSTIVELQKAAKKCNSKRNDLNGRTDEYAEHARDDLKNCEKLLGFGIDDLQHVLKVAHKTKTKTIPNQADQILVWLTAVRAYQTTCVNEIKDEKLQKEIAKMLEKANKHTYNSQKIIYNVAKILNDFGMDLSGDKGASGRRRLLEEGQVIIEQHGFPSWVPFGDRRLLGDDESNEDGGDDKRDEPKPKPKPDDDEDDKPHEPKLTGQEYFRSIEPGPMDKMIKPNVIVAQDGSGQFKTIKEALAADPLDHKGRYIIYIKSGVYNEGQIVVNRQQHNVYMYGDGCGKTIITGQLSNRITNIATSNTATFVAEGERFMARNIGFRNTIGPIGGQAVAFRSQSPHTVMVECSFEGYQSTLYYHTHDQFYKNCVVSGTKDFVFGRGRAFFQDTKFVIRNPENGQTNTIIADGRMKYEEAAGVVFQNCQIMAAPELAKATTKSYLGRPWAPRVAWSGFEVFEDEEEAAKYCADKFIDAGSWLPKAGVPVNLKL
ncbi:hypothetical protein M8C21_013044 [Ambrosia artemisiifolia]|uniref:Pectinesterase inhibitor domain-containing protein n=1 Tax=Ambrosia artemisiifolia TaxID=4212 RepID=A0AAD5D0C5_AMBAR|nr:hypothetical protein M8C21_013044 [Ambrosia artemisiifolia]